MDYNNVFISRGNTNDSGICLQPLVFITAQQPSLIDKYQIGGKAKNLFSLQEIGLNVPQWGVIPQEVLYALVPKHIQQRPYTEIIDYIHSIKIPIDFINQITSNFSNESYYAVRSSAIDEDGTDFSFAGQFDSYLFVSQEELAEKIKMVWCSAFSKRVQEYRYRNRLMDNFGISVIIQKMIHATVSGVAFGINPSTGNRNEKVISAVYGLGEGLVSGNLDADHFIVKEDEVESLLVEKKHQLVFDANAKKGTKMVTVSNEKREAATLTIEQNKKIEKILNLGFQKYGKAQDMEFAIVDEDIYLLQTRPITNLNAIPNKLGNYTLWDNSNIIESYPGVTTPLTFSFINDSYKTAYKLFCRYMGVSKHKIEENDRIFTNTLGLLNGRVYYNLKTWYHMLALVPAYSINARFMETMMGVKERFDIPENFRLSKRKAGWNILKMGVKMFMNFFALPKKRKAFKHLLDKTIAKYKRIDYESKNANELMQLYLNFEKKLLNEWKAPLLNDFFAMIWFGLLQKKCSDYLNTNNPNIHNDLLCGSYDIISTDPIHKCIALATKISESDRLKHLFLSRNAKEVWNILLDSQDMIFLNLKKDIEQYLNEFGERCIGELKLETISHNQDPSKFIKTLKSYVATGFTVESVNNNIEQELRTKAEDIMKTSLKYNFFKRIQFRHTLKYARELVSERENLRYERTRAFGIVRTIFSEIGKSFFAENILADSRDIFYLTKEEIFSFIEGTAVTQNLQSLITLRKEEFENFKTQDTPSERFATYGPVYHANDFFSKEKIEPLHGDLKGIGCCPGRVRGHVKVISNPEEVSSLDGDILVTSSTDPGWVTLFPTASAIIVERGSLLSHSAIVSREMGKPCIVSVCGLLDQLKTGDEIEMDGSIGEIKILKKA